jgi:ribosomal protein S4
MDTRYAAKASRDRGRRVQKGTMGKQNPRAKKKGAPKHGKIRREKAWARNFSSSRRPFLGSLGSSEPGSVGDPVAVPWFRAKARSQDRNAQEAV